MFLAYNANNGLPFVPVYRVSVEIPNAARLAPNNEVRIGGNRVGVVESIDTVGPTGRHERPDGARSGVGNTGCVAAKLNLKLDKSPTPLPEDSIFRVRYKSSFGLKYLEIIRGTGTRPPRATSSTASTTATMPAADDPRPSLQTEPSAKTALPAQTEFDDDRQHLRHATRGTPAAGPDGFGDAFAGRGASLNEAIERLDPLFANLKPVAQGAGRPDTQLAGFFPALGRTPRIVAPVAMQHAELFTNGAIAFARDLVRPAGAAGHDLGGPPVLRDRDRVAARASARSSPTSPSSRGCCARASATCARRCPTLNDAIDVGTPVLPAPRR